MKFLIFQGEPKKSRVRANNMNKLNLSRRDFLKLASTGTLAFALKDLRLDEALAAPAIKFGRITWSGIPLYDAPNFNANKIHLFGADQVIEITSINENGEPGNPYNRVWYQVNGGDTPIQDGCNLWKRTIKSRNSIFLKKDRLGRSPSRSA